MKTAQRLTNYLSHYAGVYSGSQPIWHQFIDVHLREEREPWSFISLTEVSEIQYEVLRAAGMPKQGVSQQALLGILMDMRVLTALGTWNVTRGIYRLDPTLLRALWDTPISGDLPGEMFKRLPEWCVYVETPIGATLLGQSLLGFFAHLDPDPRGLEIRLLPDIQPLPGNALPGWFPVGVPLTGTLEEGLKTFSSLANPPEALFDWVSHALSVLLYLCTADPGYDEQPPQRPTPKDIKRAMYPRKNAEREYRIGKTIGGQLRSTRTSSNTTGGKGGEKSFHMRKHHWHTYWVGSRDERHKEKLWIPWLKIRPDRMGEEQPPVIHPVK